MAELWLCISKVSLAISEAPRGRGLEVGRVDFGEHVVFTPFPKRPVVASDLLSHGYLRCRRVDKDGHELCPQGWVSCNSSGVHFVRANEKPTAAAESDASKSWWPCGMRSAAQNGWLNSLPRLSMPSEAQVKDVSGARMVGSLRGKFRGVVICDAMAGYGMAARPCMDRVAERWLLDAFEEEVEVVSTLDLAGRLERRSVQDRHRLLVLLIQEPHAWAARAALGGFWGTYLAEGEKELHFAAGAQRLRRWLQSPVESAGNVHVDGLMSLWCWYLRDLARAAAAPSNRHVALCKVEDLLFDPAKLLEELKKLGLRPREERVASPISADWRQAIEAYRLAASFSAAEVAAIDAATSNVTGGLVYADTDAWQRWCMMAEQQTALLSKQFDAGLLASNEDQENEAPRRDPADGQTRTLEQLCRKYEASLSRFDAEQYFWSHCWPTATTATRSTFPFHGLWTYPSGVLRLEGGAVHWQSGRTTAIEPMSDHAFDLELDGETFQGQLKAGEILVFSDGDVWNREQVQEERVARPSGACKAPDPDPEKEPEEELVLEPNEEPPARADLVAAMAEVLFKAVAKAEVATVRQGLQQVSLLGQGAVQGLLSSRDEQGDTLLDLAITGARSGPAQPGYSELVRLLTAEGAPEAVAEGPAHELRADEVKRPSPTEAVADEGAGDVLALLRSECRGEKEGDEAELVKALAERMFGHKRAEGVPAGESGQRSLHGVRIVDACAGPAGPFSAAALAALGAEVVKLQPDGEGVGEVEAKHLAEKLQGVDDWSMVPQPLVLDLQFHHNQLVLNALLGTAHCLIHTFRSNTAERVGMGKALIQKHPELLVISISGQSRQASLFTFEAILEGRSAAEAISPEVAAKMIRGCLGDSGRHVRVSVTG